MAADVKCNDKAGAVIAQSESQDSYGTRSLYARYTQRASAALMCAQGIFACVHSGATGRHMGAGGAVDIIEELDHRGTRPITKRQASHINPPHADASNPLSLRQSASSLPFPSLAALFCLAPATLPFPMSSDNKRFVTQGLTQTRRDLYVVAQREGRADLSIELVNRVLLLSSLLSVCVCVCVRIADMQCVLMEVFWLLAK